MDEEEEFELFGSECEDQQWDVGMRYERRGGGKGVYIKQMAANW